jgi:hypothetical protein
MGLRRALQLSYKPIGDDNRRAPAMIFLFGAGQLIERAMKSERV